MDIALGIALLGSKIGAALLVAFGIGLVIFVHELGHFLAAKKVGVRVEAFSIGFGPILLKRRWGETEYRLSLLPLGGYVKMAGEDPSGKKSYAPDEFTSKPVGARALVLAAGTGMNLIFAFVSFIVAFRIGVPFTAAEIGDVLPGDPGWVAGLQPGDKVVEINGKSRVDFEELLYATVLNPRGHKVDLVIERDGKRLHVAVTPKKDPRTGMRTIGVYPAYETRISRIYGYKDEDGSGPAIRAGLRVHDEIMKINDEPVQSWLDVRRIVSGSPGETLRFEVRRGEKLLDVSVTPKAMVPYQIGVSCAASTLKAVKRNSLPYELGFRAGDVIAAVNGEQIRGMADFVDRINEPDAHKFAVEILRGAKTVQIGLSARTDEEKASFLSGVWPVYGLTVDRVAKGFPAEAAGIKPGDRIISIDDHELEDWSDLLKRVSSSRGETMLIAWESNGEHYGPVPIAAKPNPKAAVGQIGVSPEDKKILVKYGLIDSCIMGSHKTRVMLIRLLRILSGLATREVSPRSVGGIILIFQASYYAALAGIGKLIYFLGFLSMNLFVFNLIPIPLLDGGGLVLLGIEKIKGRPVSETTLRIAQYIGLVILLALMLYIIRNDILRLLG